MKLLFALLLVAIVLVSGCTTTRTQEEEPQTPDTGIGPEVPAEPTYLNCDDYKHGDSWHVECNTCSCDNGTTSCTEMDCTPPEPIIPDKVACGDGRCSTNFLTLSIGQPQSLEWKGKVYSLDLVSIENLTGTFTLNGENFVLRYGETKEIENNLSIYLNTLSIYKKAVFFIYEDSNSCPEDCVS